MDLGSLLPGSAFVDGQPCGRQSERGRDIGTKIIPMSGRPTALAREASSGPANRCGLPGGHGRDSTSSVESDKPARRRGGIEWLEQAVWLAVVDRVAAFQVS